MSWSLTSFWLTQEMRQVGCSRLYWIWDGFSSELYCFKAQSRKEFIKCRSSALWRIFFSPTTYCMEALMSACVDTRRHIHALRPPYIMCHSEAISMKWEWAIKYSVWHLLTLQLRWRKPRELEFQVSFQNKTFSLIKSECTFTQKINRSQKFLKQMHSFPNKVPLHRWCLHCRNCPLEPFVILF